MLGMIWAQAREAVIGETGDMPWRLPEDMARFKAITSGHPVVMGRRTWESFPERFRPLPGRDNIVITSNPDFVAPGARVVGSLDEALAAARALLDDPDGEVWVIGGGRVYRDALPAADRLEITDIDLEASGDTTAPDPTAPDSAATDPTATDSAAPDPTAPDFAAPDSGSHNARPPDAPWREVARDPATGWHVSRTGLRYAYRTLERVTS